MSTLTDSISILIVEDVDEMRHLLAHALQEIDEFRVTGLAQNSFEARMEISRRRPDLVLLDEVLPGESSHDLLQEFAVQKSPVMLMTSLEKPSSQIPAPALGRMAKPGWKSIDEDRNRIKTFIFQKLKRSQA